MKRTDRNALIALPILILLGWLFGRAGSQAGSSFLGMPVFASLVGLAFLIQWLAFIPAYMLRSERFFDLTGSITYIAVVAMGVLLSPGVDNRSILLAALVIIWAVRLGTYLFRRIQRTGRDDRLDEMKSSFIRFLNVWTIQAVWVSITVGAALAAITTAERKALDGFAILGALVWLLGFAIEVRADSEKTRFSMNPKNKGRFIQTGLWARSRHPNYFGEIVLWFGVALMAFPVLRGWQYVTLLSPVFVILLLTRISGIPLLENKADKKWGGQQDYEAYKRSTPVLIPRL